MKINGQRAELRSTVHCVLPRENGDIVFKAVALLDTSDYEKLYPAPTPPSVLKRGDKQAFLNVEDPTYKKELAEWAGLKMHWMVLKSLQLPDGWEWETIDLSDRTTWTNYIKELNDAGLTPFEISRVVDAVLEANGLNQSKIDEAQKRFLAGLANQSSV